MSNNVILTIVTENMPRVAAKDRVQIEPLGESFTRVVAAFRLHGSA